MVQPKMSVLVTGASTGIGQGSAVALLRAGYRVFGSVRRDEDAARLTRELGQGFTPLFIDVTDSNSVERAVQKLGDELEDGCLAGLVNNAGIALPGPLAAQSFEEIRAMFEVNLFGVLSVTRACLPLLGMRQGHPRAPGKIINISSGAGKMSFPFLGAYVASKHALEGLSSSLRRELMPYDIAVVVVGPGNVKTPIWNKVAPESAYDHTPYGAVFRNFLRFMFAGAERGMLPAEIGELIVTIMREKQPKTRYAPMAQKFSNWTLPRLLPDRQVDRMIYKTLGMSKLG
jgi:NAD(P)-dependent dehydrogenase (short-subunit alcohol dehydrogenase family)